MTSRPETPPRPGAAPPAGGPPRGRLRTVVAIALLAAAAGAAGWFASRRSRAPDAGIPAQVHIVRDGLRYEFDALTRRESLFLVGPDGGLGRDVLAERPEAARDLRARLERDLGLESLDVLVERHRETAEALRRLGYL